MVPFHPYFPRKCQGIMRRLNWTSHLLAHCFGSCAPLCIRTLHSCKQCLFFFFFQHSGISHCAYRSSIFYKIRVQDSAFHFMNWKFKAKKQCFVMLVFNWNLYKNAGNVKEAAMTWNQSFSLALHTIHLDLLNLCTVQ